MPYALRGNKVVKADTGEVVKDHGSDHEKAVRHLRALKANVEEGRLCECGAPARGLVCQRGHRLELREGWDEWDEMRKGARVFARRNHTTAEPGRVLKDRTLTVERNDGGVLAARDDTTGDLHTYSRLDAGDALSVRSPVQREVDKEKEFNVRSDLDEAWSPQARAAALAARIGHGHTWDEAEPGQSFRHPDGTSIAVKKKLAKHVVLDVGGQDARVARVQDMHPGLVPQAGGFKARPPQELAQRGR